MLKKAKFLAKEAKLRLNYMTSKDCIFCKFAKREMKTKLLLENDKVIAFNDINPVAKVHILIVPKKHIDSVMTIGENEGTDLVAMYEAATKLGSSQNLDAYRLTFNAGKYQHVGHLHMHLLAGGKIEWSKL